MYLYVMCMYAQQSVGACGGIYACEKEFTVSAISSIAEQQPMVPTEAQELIYSKLDVDCISHVY